MSDKLTVEAQIEGAAPKTVEATRNAKDVAARVQEVSGLAEPLHIFERDADEPIGKEISERKVLVIVAHRCKKIHVSVRYEHRTESRDFPPSATIQRVLQWAISKKVFGLDDDARSKANLMLPGADSALPGDSVLGQYTKHPDCSLILELTLKDFTNGSG